MEATIKDIVSELILKGYKINESNIRYYHSLGMLPDSEKVGRFQQGVSLVFPDKEEVMSILLKIFDYKGRGYKLTEISDILRVDREKKYEEKCIKDLKRYREINGKYFLYFDELPDGLRIIKRLRDVLSADIERECRLGGVRQDENRNDLDEIEKRGLFLIDQVYKGKNVFSYSFAVINHHILSWLILHRDYEIDWDLLEQMQRKHKSNLNKFFFWPDPDGLRFSEASIGFQKQNVANEFGETLLSYFANIKSDSIFGSDRMPRWDYRYKTTDEFIKDFIAGKCAFVPLSEPRDDFFMFLKHLS